MIQLLTTKISIQVCIKFYIVLSLILYFYYGNKNKELGFLLFFAVVNGFMTYLFKSYEIKSFLNNNLYILFHNFTWFYIIRKKKDILLFKDFYFFLLVIISLLTFINTSIFNEFNYYNFIFGALAYTFIFIIESYKNLKNSSLIFFTSNNFILLFAPILFFLGMSFLLGFKSKSINSILVFGDLTFYMLINYSVNIIYYTLINIYIYKERKLNA